MTPYRTAEPRPTTVVPHSYRPRCPECDCPAVPTLRGSCVRHPGHPSYAQCAVDLGYSHVHYRCDCCASVFIMRLS